MGPMEPMESDLLRPTEAHRVTIDVYTTHYRVTGSLTTRFTRVADILNGYPADHLSLEQATVSVYDDPAGTLSAIQLYVTVSEILFLSASVQGEARPEMRIVKRPVRVQLGLGGFRLTGSVYVPPGGLPADGLLNAAERFLAMTEVSISAAAHPELDRTFPAVGVQRARAHLFLVTDDASPDEALSTVLDEQTAEAWLNPGPRPVE